MESHASDRLQRRIAKINEQFNLKVPIAIGSKYKCVRKFTALALLKIDELKTWMTATLKEGTPKQKSNILFALSQMK